MHINAQMEDPDQTPRFFPFCLLVLVLVNRNVVVSAILRWLMSSWTLGRFQMTGLRGKKVFVCLFVFKAERRRWEGSVFARGPCVPSILCCWTARVVEQKWLEAVDGVLSDRVCERTDDPARFKSEALWFCPCQRVRNGEEVTIYRRCQTISNRKPTALVFDTDWSPFLVFMSFFLFFKYHNNWSRLNFSRTSYRTVRSGSSCVPIGWRIFYHLFTLKQRNGGGITYLGTGFRGISYLCNVTLHACLESDWFSLEISVDSLRLDVSGWHNCAAWILHLTLHPLQYVYNKASQHLYT